jgi:hypothetical protein
LFAIVERMTVREPLKIAIPPPPAVGCVVAWFLRTFVRRRVREAAPPVLAMSMPPPLPPVALSATVESTSSRRPWLYKPPPFPPVPAKALRFSEIVEPRTIILPVEIGWIPALL